MENRKRSLSSPSIKMEVVALQPEKPYLITTGIDSFPATGELLDVKEVVKNFETSPMLPMVCPKTETMPPIPSTSTVVDQRDPAIGGHTSNDGSNLDPKKIKRSIANRAYAERARQRKLEYIEKLKQNIKTEEDKLCVMGPQLSYLEVEHVILKKENDTLKEMLKAFANIKLRKEAEYEALKAEVKEMYRAINYSPKDEK